MRTTTLSVMKKLAAEQFKLKDVSFEGFEKIDMTEVGQTTEDVEDLDAQVDVWAKLKLTYDGEAPDGYRLLNSMIMDWVDENEDKLKVLINKQLIPFLKDQYKGIDVEDLDENFDDYIWEDQVDYMPEIDEDEKTVDFVIELVLDVVDQDEDEDD